MALLFWDASALVKRYFIEDGSATVDTLFAAAPGHHLATTPWGYLETYSILVRRLNGGVLDKRAFTYAVTSLQAEVVNEPSFGFLPIGDTTIFASSGTIQKHNLNATDAAILTMLCEYVRSVGQADCVLIAVDLRLNRAADIEGLRTLNPEIVAVTDVPGFLASL